MHLICYLLLISYPYIYWSCIFDPTIPTYLGLFGNNYIFEALESTDSMIIIMTLWFVIFMVFRFGRSYSQILNRLNV